MERKEMLSRVKAALREAFGDRLHGVVLYGSEARGDADADSDVDLLVLLEEPCREPHDSWACIDSLYPLVLEAGRPIHAEPVDVAEYQAGQFPLYLNAQKEGIVLCGPEGR